MDNTKDDRYYVSKLINDVEFILKHSKGISIMQFSEDELLQDSMMFRLIQISENVLKLSDNFKKNTTTYLGLLSKDYEIESCTIMEMSI